MKKALDCGYGVHFVYVLVGSVEESIARVKHRVSKGGHDVAEEKIRARWPRSLANLSWFWENSTQAFVFFNGDRASGPLLVAARAGNGTKFNPEALSLLLPAS